jgi:exonuclease III
MDSLSILSVNCQGLGNAQKRRDIFHFWKTKKYDILFLQDTHFESKLEKHISAEWGYQAFFASNNSVSRGVAIFFNNTFEFKVKRVNRDENGNYIFVLIEINNVEYLLVNIYGPNRDNPDFYKRLHDIYLDFRCVNGVMAGDWNMVLDPSLDYDNYKNVNNIKAQETVLQIIDELNLCDIWREMNPEMRRFTWRRSRPFQQSRLDYFLISDPIVEKVVEADIICGYRTDHSCITLKLNLGSKDVKRSTFWKFNTSLLRDKKYLNEINDVIENVLLEYAASPYSRDNFSSIPKEKIEYTISEDLLLDFVLMKVRSKTISYATMKKKKENEQEKKLETEIDILEKRDNKNETDFITLEEKKEELKDIREKRIEGVLLRSKARWVSEGEKVSHYFCNLEKRHFVSKMMTKIVDNGKEISDSKQILEKVKLFYEKLYENKEVEQCEINDLVKELPTLNELERESLEGEITYGEVCSALKNMKHLKSPGTDGFNAEFFKTFWGKLGHMVVRALNASFRAGILTPTQRQGIITCIPKGDKPREYIQNWRPISLLNVLYKIGSTCIAQRIKKVLPSLVNEDQTGFIQGRYIGDNIRLIYDMIDYLNKKNRPGLLLNIDFEKAFDSLNWGFMQKVLKSVGFGEMIRKWIYVFYNDIKSTVIVNGSASTWFNIHRGCRQGDPISPYIFVLCVEILAIMIRENKDIKGVVINDIEHKISQYADDTEFTLNGDRKSFEACIEILDSFGRKSGLIINPGKSSAMWLGSKKNSPVKFMEHLNIIWNPPKTKILGIWFTNTLNDCIQLNYSEKFYEVRRLTQIWLKRNITPLGRVAVLKSLILSKLIHLWILLPKPPDNLINDLQKLCYSFVWGNKIDRISRKTAIKSIYDGGMGLPDIRKYIMSLKLTWIRKFKVNNHKWKNIILENFDYFNKLDMYGPEITKKYKAGNFFWVEVFDAYKEYFYKIDVNDSAELLSEPVCFNKRILVGNNIISKETWTQHGVSYFGDFVKDTGQFFNCVEFNNKYNLSVDFVSYSGCIMSLKKYAKKHNIITVNNNRHEICNTMMKLLSVSKGSKSFYDVFVKDSFVPNCVKKWNSKLAFEVEWENVFCKIYKIQDICLRWFQMRIVHRIIATNVVLKEMNISPSELCSFCNREKDSIAHCFWNCECTHYFWQSFENWINTHCVNACNFKLSQSYVLFGTETNLRTDSTLDFIVLLAKHYIYSCKYKKERPFLHIFKQKLSWRYKIEKYNAMLSQTLPQFNVNWFCYEKLVL